MAKVEVKTEHVVCDRPGCEKKVTEKGGAMFIGGSAVRFVQDEVDIEVDDRTDAVDLCRECLQQMQSAWNRKADSE